MSLTSRRGLLERIRRSKTARESLISSNLSEGIAFQIRATRDAQDRSQAELASGIGMSQNNISRLESPDYGRYTLTSLKRIADALDVALIVRFVPFSQYIDWLSGTPHWDCGLRPEALAVPSFPEEEKRHAFDDSVIRYAAYHLNAGSAIATSVTVPPIGVATATATLTTEIPAQGTSPEALDVRSTFYPPSFLGVSADTMKAVA